MKLGYWVQDEDKFKGEKKWRWNLIWSINAPQKVNILSWLAMENKLLTWDNGFKKGWIGLGKMHTLFECKGVCTTHFRLMFIHVASMGFNFKFIEGSFSGFGR
jgi:hypothetical protein